MTIGLVSRLDKLEEHLQVLPCIDLPEASDSHGRLDFAYYPL